MLLTMSATPARAQGGPLDSRTEFTFNQSVELPGVTLPPGTYVFRFVDATTGKKVMQVQAKDASNKTYGMFMTISAQRPKASDDAELRFLETPAGQPAGGEDVVVSGQHDRARIYLSEVAGDAPCEGNQQHRAEHQDRSEDRSDAVSGPDVCLAVGPGDAPDR